jgi:hypothetical protein
MNDTTTQAPGPEFREDGTNQLLDALGAVLRDASASVS